MSIKILKTPPIGQPSTIKKIAGHVSVEGSNLKAKHTMEPVAQVPVTQHLCNVGMRIGYTKNIGKFESLKFEVSLYMPCAPKQIEATALFVEQWCDEKLTKLVEHAESELGAS